MCRAALPSLSSTSTREPLGEEGRREKREDEEEGRKKDRDGVRKAIKLTHNPYKVDKTLMLSIACVLLQWHSLIDAHHG